MKKALLIIGLLVFACKTSTDKSDGSFEIGVIADCQYCACETQAPRFYKAAKQKLQVAVDFLNTKDLEYTIHLGDFIDRGFASFDTVLPIWNALKSEKRHVLGNHDFSVADSLKRFVPNKMGLKTRYYSFKKFNWRFIVLDGNELSFYGAEPHKIKQTDSLFNQLKSDNLPNVAVWNGGLSHEQLQWIKSELDKAIVNDEHVGIYCHFPAIRERDLHNLWNFKEFQKLIQPYENVKFYFNGHNHAGDYAVKDGVHYLTFKGMLDTQDSTAFSVVQFTKDSIFIKGFGRETSRRLKIK
ncbi:metallophosphoesterase [Tamlana fucoidanivorans]|uniref:Phosphoesterase n=1 Tax=Allotamlana fucoidanivorans TaxID=2583814 RepID=A0A5C4SRJ1_9FLAO|nr:metallophosphoesterase [Tamlana fucoidanivorans]TNJ46197.1 phosphoesterase [Tamlana fucoidanivorans]